ncbi:hypothetical protein ACRTAE_002903 [Clostridium perfringens]
MKILLLVVVFISIFTIVLSMFPGTVLTLRLMCVLGWLSVCILSIKSMKELE